MKKSLKISRASSTIKGGGCSKAFENSCGIQYRNG